MTKFKGFTLAEVLITLGIIGVVAAMTMPTLINSTQGAQYKTAYKKALSVLSQAIVMNIALEDYDLSQTVEGGVNTKTHDDESQTIYTLFKNRMNVVKVADQDDFPDTAVNGDADFYKVIAIGEEEDRPDEGHFSDENGGNAALAAWVTANQPFGDMTYLFMNDGIAFIFDNSQYECAEQTSTTTDQYCFGWIDVNGQKGPNRVVECDANTYVAGTANANGGNADTGQADTSVGDNAVCTVSNPTDIYPVMFYGQTIVPATAAGRAVLYAK